MPLFTVSGETVQDLFPYVGVVDSFDAVARPTSGAASVDTTFFVVTDAGVFVTQDDGTQVIDPP